MSRLIAVGFGAIDAVAMALSFASSAGTLILLALSLVTSVTIALMSSTIRSLLWPTYFWDDPSTHLAVKGTDQMQTIAR